MKISSQGTKTETGRSLTLSNLLESLPQAIVVVGPDLRVVIFNAHFEEMIRACDSEVRPGDDFAGVMRDWARNTNQTDGILERAIGRIHERQPFVSAFTSTTARFGHRWLELHHILLTDGGFVRSYSDISELKRLRRALQSNETRALSALESSNDAVTLMNKEGILDYNAKALGMFGGESVAALEADIRPTLQALVRDVCAQIRTKAAPKENVERFRLLFEAAADPILLLDEHSRILDCNMATVAALKAPSREALLGKRPTDFSPEHQPDGELSAVKVKRNQESFDEGRVDFEWVHSRFDGSEFFVDVTLSMIAMGDCKVQLTHWRDITQRKKLERRLAQMAHYDELTKLPNRALFLENLRLELEATQRNKMQAALLFIDLDGFKQVNDRHGHDAGDALLRGVAERLMASVRKTDVVARLGGDEFTIILTNLSDARDAGLIAEKIMLALQQPFAINGQECRVGASIGIAARSSDGEDLHMLIRRADAAMYEAKRHGKNAYRFASDPLVVPAAVLSTSGASVEEVDPGRLW